jgi:hypothetical protein
MIAAFSLRETPEDSANALDAQSTDNIDSA